MNTAQLQELKAIIKDTVVKEDAIHFRNKSYPFTAANKTQTLTNILYNECYSRKVSFQSSTTVQPTINTDNSFVEKLSAANASGFEDGGWTVTEILPNGWIKVHKAGTTKTIAPAAYQPYNNTININAVINIKLPLEDRTTQPNFYYVFSNLPFLINPTTVRIYFNITSEGAPLLTAAITTILNKYRLPFLFKCLNHPALYNRRDCCVLYLEHKYYHVFKWLLPNIYSAIEKYTEPDVPLFSFAIANGVGVAEHPLNNESFGLKMMKILADCLAGSAIQSSTATEKMKQVKTAYTHAGISLDAPFLNKGSKNSFS